MAVLAGLFLVNSCSLAFEVAASRTAATYLGATAYANSVLLGSFLAGIGLGGWVASMGTHEPTRLTRRCGLLLSNSAIMSAAFAPVIGLVGGSDSSTFVRGALLTLLVLPVGFGVGFAYPALTALHSAGGQLSRSVASTYAADTIGAGAGALAAGFVLVPLLGLQATGLLAGAGMAVVGGALLVSRAVAAPKQTTSVPESFRTPIENRTVLGLFFLTGLAALSLEVAWIRLFTLVIGTSLFSFAITVAAFLTALGLGSQFMRSRVHRISDPAARLSQLLILTGAFSPILLLLTPVWERLYLAAYSATGGVISFLFALFVLGVLSVLLPAGLMGAGFSVGVRLLQGGSGQAAVPVARLYGINTLGGVLGAITAGLILLPTCGIKTTLLVSGGIYLLAGVFLSLRAARGNTRRNLWALPAGAAGVLVAVLLVPEPGQFFAPYYHGIRVRSYEAFSAARKKERLLYRQFSPYGLVTASQDAEHRYLRHNGRSEASTSPGDMSTQLLIAHLPLLMHPGPVRVLNIGLGAGFTLGAIEQHPEPKAIVQVELDPRIVEAARRHFADVNAGALSDTRLVVHVNDGRKLLASDRSIYDVIISEPSHLWVSGVSGLFTAEFYRIVGERLAPGGIFATWVPRYEMGPDDIQTIAATLLDEFEQVTAFENGPADIIFLASKTPFAPSLQRVQMALAVGGVHRDIERALVGFPLAPENLTSLLEQVAANAALMPQSVTGDTPRNTDDWPVLEFHTAMAAISKRATQAGQGQE